MALSTALVSGIAGLKVHNTMLDVISNNIANVNTTGYKYSRVNFSDAISQTSIGAAGPSSGYGGVNPGQVGLGVSVSSIDTIMTQGPMTATGNVTDMAIDGEGFFMVREGNQIVYTRAGDFTFDSSGNLVDRSGAIVQGWNISTAVEERIYNAGPQAMYEGIYELDNTRLSDIQNIQIDPDFTMMPRSTHVVTLSGNLDSGMPQNAAAGIDPALVSGGLPSFGMDTATLNFAGAPVAWGSVANAQATDGTATELFVGATPDHTSTSIVYDTLGQEREVTFWFFQTNDLTAAPPANNAEWAWYAFDTTDGPADASNVQGGTGLQEIFDRNTALQFPIGEFLAFNPDGSLQMQGAVGPNAQQEFKPILYLDRTNWTTGPISPYPSPPFTPPTTGMPWQIGTERYIMVTVHFGSAWESALDTSWENHSNFSVGNGKFIGGAYRDGITGDAAGTMQTIDGVSTYVPYNSAFVDSQDGYEQGSMVSMNVAGDGTIIGSFSNDQITALGQVAIATFANPEGLQRVGTSKFTLSANSGAPIRGVATTGTRGAVRSGYLEESNVELADQLTRMIIAQRGFEVNSRTISTANSILNTLVSLGQ